MTLSYGYDALSRRASMSDSLGGTTSYTFDGEDRLASLTTPWGGLIGQSYDVAGRPLRMTYPNGLDADISFEAQTGRLAGLAHRAGSLASPLASFQHLYDVRGNLARLTELSGTRAFAYDRLERVTAVTPQAPLGVGAEAYAYDAEGNRTASRGQPGIVTDDANRTLDDGINAYTWDAKGAEFSRDLAP